jgi:ankyrin repeat protein
MKKEILVFFIHFIIVLQKSVMKERIEYSKIILEIYNSKLEDKSDLIKWIEKRNNKGVQALEIASQKCNKEVIWLIYSYYENNNKYLILNGNEYSNVFHQSAKKNEIYPIVFFFEKLKDHYPENILNLKNKNGMIPLHYASHCSNKRVIDILLDLGSDINSKDKDGNTPLHHAVNSSKNKIIKF